MLLLFESQKTKIDLTYSRLIKFDLNTKYTQAGQITKFVPEM